MGKAIAYLRKRAGYTQKELAERIGISDKAVSKWERGQGLPEIGYLSKLSILLDTDTDSLLAGDVAHHKSEWVGLIVINKSLYGIGASTVIYDKPLIYFLISYFLLVGIKEIYISCSDDDAKYINEELKNGNDYGIVLYTIVGGIEVVSKTFDSKYIKDKTVMMVYGRCLLYGVDQTRFFQRAMMERSRFTMLVLPKKISQNSITVDEDKRIVNAQEKSKNKLRTQYDFSEIPIAFFPAEMISDIANANSLVEFIEELKDKEKVFVEMLDRGYVEIEIDNWDDVQEASTFLRIVQEKCGMNVYCLEEVAWRRGMISLDKLKRLGEKKRHTEYGEYILELYDRLSQRTVRE